MNIRTKPEPYCPKCGGKMILRKPKPNQDWPPFWGCAEYFSSDCNGSRNILPNGLAEDFDYDTIAMFPELDPRTE